jgi:hypothetical protein
MLNIHINQYYISITYNIMTNQSTPTPTTTTPTPTTVTQVPKSNVISGKDFNAIYACEKDYVYKLFNKKKIHHGYQYPNAGLYTLKDEFDGTNSCGPGALYSCFTRDVQKWANRNGEKTFYISRVHIPDDAKVLVMKTQIKSDKINIDEPESIWTSSAFRKSLSHYANKHRYSNERLTFYKSFPLEIATPEFISGIIEECSQCLSGETFNTVIRRCGNRMTFDHYKQIIKCQKDGVFFGVTIPRRHITKKLCRELV